VPEHPSNHNGSMPQAPLDARALDRALAAFPGTTCLMTSAYEDERAGVLVHGVLVASHQPPMVVVACRKGHAIDPIIRDARCFALGLVDPDDKLIRRRFRFADTAVAMRADPDASDPFDPFPEQRLVTGAPILERCRVWVDCQIARHFDLESEHELFVGLVVAVRVRD